MSRPSDRQIAEAKKYLEQRLKIERSASIRIRRLVDEYAERIILAKRQSRREQLIRELSQKISALMDYYVQACPEAVTEDDKQALILMSHQPTDGIAPTDRVRAWLQKLPSNSDTNPSDKEATEETSRTLSHILTIASFTIASAWMKQKLLRATRSGSQGFYSYRGSQYPCSTCDMNTGYHPITDPPPPYHPHCCCYIVPA